jgi:hypothetical protein
MIGAMPPGIAAPGGMVTNTTRPRRGFIERIKVVKIRFVHFTAFDGALDHQALDCLIAMAQF